MWIRFTGEGRVLLPLREKVSAKLTDEGATWRSGFGDAEMRRGRSDPSSVACGDTFSRKGRRDLVRSSS
jgi:hypothetical protein